LYIKICHSNAFGQSLIYEFFHFCPELMHWLFGSCIIMIGPMNHIEINIFDSKSFERTFNCSLYIIDFCVPYFCRNKEFISFHTLSKTFLQSVTNNVFIFVFTGSINMPISCFKYSINNGLFCCLVCSSKT